MKNIFHAFGNFLVGVVKMFRFFIITSFLFLLATFILTIIFPQNVHNAIEIFKNLLKI